MKLLSPFYNLLSLTAIVLFLPSLFFGKQTFDVHLHDTYFIIGIGQFLKLNAFILLALWMVYKLCDNILYSPKLTNAHVIMSVLSLILVSTVVFWGRLPIWTPGTNYVAPVTTETVSRWRQAQIAIGITVLLFGVGQIILIINVIAGLAKR